MRILVTGASGFLGSHIAEKLAADGHEVRLLLRPTSSRQFLLFEYDVAVGDVTDSSSLASAVTGVDAVVHAAGLIKARNEAEFAAVNEGGTENLVQACEEAAPALRQFVYISSLAARGPGDGTKPSAPVSAYGRTKLAGEQRLRKSSLVDRATIFQMPVIYGPRDPALVPVFLGARFRLTPLLNGGRNRISLIYATDAAGAVVSALGGEPGGPRTYAPEDGRAHTWRDLVEAVGEAVGHRLYAFPVPVLAYAAAAGAAEAFGRISNRAMVFTADKVREMEQKAWVCSGASLTADTGWRPRMSIKEGAALTYGWYQENGWL